MPRFSTASSGERVKSLGIFLQCTPEGEGTSWSCQASAKITIINQKVADESFFRSKSLKSTLNGSVSWNFVDLFYKIWNTCVSE